MGNEMSKYTAGPWIQAGPSYGGKKMVYTSEIHTEEPDEDCVYQEICNMPRWCVEFDEENEANAQLISAAPDLLEALQTMVDKLGPTPSEKVKGLAEARAAIKKAIG
jgi:hypothetical protein